MNQPQLRNPPKRNNKLAVGDQVMVADRFFNNRGIEKLNLGMGFVRKLLLEEQRVILSLAFNPVIIMYAINGYLKVDGYEPGPVMRIKVLIHVAYVDRFVMKRRRHGKEK